MGRATVKRFAEKGSKVIFCDIQESIGHKTAEEIGSNVHFIPADVRKAEDIKQVLDQIEAKYGKLNTVINCAGIGNAYLIYNFNKNLPRRLDDFTKIIQVRIESLKEAHPTLIKFQLFFRQIYLVHSM